MSNKHIEPIPIEHETCKLITCVLPDDGTEKNLIRALRDEKNITRVNSISCMGIAVLGSAKTKFGELPEPIFTRKVDIVVAEKNVDELYAYIFKKARINRAQGGAMWHS